MSNKFIDELNAKVAKRCKNRKGTPPAPLLPAATVQQAFDMGRSYQGMLQAELEQDHHFSRSDGSLPTPVIELPINRDLLEEMKRFGVITEDTPTGTVCSHQQVFDMGMTYQQMLQWEFDQEHLRPSARDVLPAPIRELSVHRDLFKDMKQFGIITDDTPGE